MGAIVNNSGIGLRLSEMSESQFKAHRDRVLARMTTKGASPADIKQARERINKRRADGEQVENQANRTEETGEEVTA